MFKYELRFAVDELTKIKSRVEDIIEKLHKLESKLGTIQNAECVLNVSFEAEEWFVWHVDIDIRFKYADGSSDFINVYRTTESKNKTPYYIDSAVVRLLTPIYNPHKIDFNPNEWEWIDDGQLSRWTKIKKRV